MESVYVKGYSATECGRISFQCILTRASFGRMTACAAIYRRISLDAAMDGLAIERQREDCGAIAKQCGWTVVHTYVDLLVLRFLKENMRKVIVLNNVSLDGVMQAPGRPGEDERNGFDRGGWA